MIEDWFRSVLSSLSGSESFRKNLRDNQVLAFYGTSKLTTKFTTALHLSPSCARWTQSMFSHMIYFKNHFNIILLSTPRSSTLPYWNCVCTPILFHTILTLHSSHPHSFETWIKFGKDRKSRRSSLWFFFFLTFLSAKYPPQHPILKHPQCMFFPECETQSFTPI